MAKNPLIRSYPKRVNTPQPNKSAGILDDFAVRKNVCTKEGTIEHTPTADNHIANKKYVDDETPWERTGTNVHLKTSADNVGIGTTTPSADLEISDAGGGILRIDDTTSVETDLQLGSIYFAGNKGGQHDKVARISACSEGAEHWSANTNDHAGTCLEFYTQDSTTNDLTADGNARMVITKDGNVGIGTTGPATSAKLDLTSTTGALLLTRMTTVQKNALTAVNGMILYDTTLNKVQVYEGGAWASVI